MKGLDTLIRLHRLRLDEAHKALAELDRQRTAILEDMSRLDEELLSERSLASSSFEATMAYGTFAVATQDRKQALAQEVAELDQRIEVAAEKVTAAYRELKKYEVTAERRRAEAKREADRREQGELDEMGLTIHRRRDAR